MMIYIEVVGNTALIIIFLYYNRLKIVRKGHCNYKPYREKGVTLNFKMNYLYILYEVNMFNVLIDEKKATSVPCPLGWKNGLLIQGNNW